MPPRHPLDPRNLLSAPRRLREISAGAYDVAQTTAFPVPRLSLRTAPHRDDNLPATCWPRYEPQVPAETVPTA